MTLPLDAAARPADVGALTGVMLGIGYISAAVAPVLMGAVRDVVGTFNASIGLLALPAAALAVLSMQLTRDRLATARDTT
jgi:CP family cyanate transporter-like MFS transporter